MDNSDEAVTSDSPVLVESCHCLVNLTTKKEAHEGVDIFYSSLLFSLDMLRLEKSGECVSWLF